VNLIIPVICSLTVIVLIFLFIFAFRIPAAQINREMEETLQALYADQRPDVERRTLLLRSREPQAGELSAVVVLLREYEPIDTNRQLLPTAFETYYNGTTERVLWRETWAQADYDAVKVASATAFEAKLGELQADGWRITFELAFSQVDSIVFLEK
jgi:hypothetical protein